MPHMCGDDATRAIWLLGCLCVIVGVTGNVLEQDINEFKEAGLDVVLVKPHALGTLPAKLDEVLHTVPAHREAEASSRLHCVSFLIGLLLQVIVYVLSYARIHASYYC